MSKSSIAEQMHEIEKLVFNGKHTRVPIQLRLLLITNTKWLIAYKGHFQVSLHASELSWARNVDYDRGKILDAFARLELLVNAHIQAMITGGNNTKGELLEQILESVDLASRLKFLRDNGVISGKVVSDAYPLKQVRNDMAHDWELDLIEYRGISLKHNMDMFRKDFGDLWQILVTAYEKEQQNFDFESIKKLIIDANPQ